jgi:hypothetical protein
MIANEVQSADICSNDQMHSGFMNAVGPPSDK